MQYPAKRQGGSDAIVEGLLALEGLPHRPARAGGWCRQTFGTQAFKRAILIEHLFYFNERNR